jgi:glycosyltransferase involved in cell wall biosynthesis
MVIREAFAYGTPVACSRIGPLPSIVDNGTSGFLFEPGRVDSIVSVILNNYYTEGRLEAASIEARRQYESKYTERINYEMINSIYQKIAESSK